MDFLSAAKYRYYGKDNSQNVDDLLVDAKRLKSQRTIRGRNMTEQEAKFLCKWAIENGQRQLTPVEKELLKKGIDAAKSFQDFLAVALAAMAIS